MGFLQQKIANNKTLLNGMLFSLFSFFNKGVMFLLMLVLAGFITPSEFGYLSLFSTVIMVMGYFMAMSSEGYMSVVYFHKGLYGAKQAVSTVLAVSLIMTAFFLVLLLFFGDFLSDKLSLPCSTLYIAVVICFFTVYTNLNLDFFRIKEQVRKYGLYSCSNALLNFAISILLIGGFMLGWQGRVYAQAVCYSLFGILGLLFFIKNDFISKPDFSFSKEMLLWAIPMIPHMATNFLRQGCDRYIINFHYSISDVGLFSFALNLANILLMVGIGFNQSNSVDIFKTLGDKNYSNEEKKVQLSKHKKQIFIIYTVSAIFVFMTSFFLTPFILPKYSDCVKYLPFLTLSMYFNCLYFLYTNFLFYYKSTKWLMYTTFASSIIHLALSLCLTKYSLVITSAIYCVSNLIMLVITIGISKKIVKKNLC